ncbi:hypothetical protein [Sphingomonas sp. Marseille-Q8236]|jgi:hypothetical protein
MADRFVVDAAVAALLPREDAARLGGDFVLESTKSAPVTDRLCQVKDCNVAMRVGQRVCDAHWAALPGKDRSRLSMSRHGRVADEMWAKAVARLEGAVA